MAEPFDTSTAPDIPTVADVERIAAIPNPVLRNLQITHCYSRLATAVAERTGREANWCCFATWASRQAGSTIRGEDAGAFLQARLGHHAELTRPLTSLWRWLLRRGLLNPASRLGRLTAEIHTPFDAIERAANGVARGNLKVFEEIGLEFARFLHECPPDAAPDGPELRAFLDGLRPGDPPDGQRYLRDAFLRYQAAVRQPDATTRAQLLFAANLEIGFHEQTRLQPEIFEALNAPYVTHEDLGRRVLDAVLPPGTRGRRLVPDPVAAPAVGWLAGRVERFSDELAREIVTETFMVLSLPGRVLALRDHLHDAYPEALLELTDAEVAELVTRFEPVPPAPDDCGARDWSVFEQRMHYISHLFRTSHEQRSLFDPPFTPDQVDRIRAGAIPDGQL